MKVRPLGSEGDGVPELATGVLGLLLLLLLSGERSAFRLFFAGWRCTQHASFALSGSQRCMMN